ncbi:hypothetical protein THAOC_15147, partial [Thalassiosira oceanica]
MVKSSLGSALLLGLGLAASSVAIFVLVLSSRKESTAETTNLRRRLGLIDPHTMEIKGEGEGPLYDSKVVTLPLEGSSPDLTQALECLRKTKPNLVLSEYPSDSFEHYTFIHQRLSTWTQQPNHVPHSAAGYVGPWMENHFISRFQPLIKSRADLIHHFGP